MEIKILGTGCPKCKRLEELARQALVEAQVEATLLKVTDIDEILSYPISSTSGLGDRREGSCLGAAAAQGRDRRLAERAWGVSAERSCCSGPTGTCCGPSTVTARKLAAEFLYLDLDSCTWCQETERNLEAVMAQVGPVLDALGVELSLSKRQVRGEAEATALGMTVSPTVRLNGRDIQRGAELAHCGPCSELCGEATDCRVWSH